MTQFEAIIIGDESLTQHCAEVLLAEAHSLLAVVTDNPDLATWAQTRGIRVEHHGKDLGARLNDVGADWVLSIANLKLLPPDVIRLGKQGAVNFHDGPLPRHAGLNAPVWALLENEEEHGITWHLIEDGIDTGDIILQQTVEISPDDTALTLNTKCYEAGLTSFPDLLAQLSQGLPSRKKQDATQRTYHALTDRPEANGVLDLAAQTDTAQRLIRALDHGPYWNPLCTAKLLLDDGIVHVGQAEKIDSKAAVGTVIDVDKVSLTVAFSEGALKFTNLRATDGKSFDPSRHLSLGQVLPNMTPDARAAVTDVARSVASYDAYWRKTLIDSRPVTLPFLTKGEPQIKATKTEITGTHLGEALGLVARRLASGQDVALALTNADVVADAQTGIVSAWVPVMASVLEARVPAINAGFACDLPLRDPDIPSVTPPAIGISLNAGPIAGVALTFEVSGQAIIAHADTGQISQDFADILTRRIQWVSDQIRDGKPQSKIDPLPPEERRSVLHDFNDTAIDLGSTETMHAAFEAQVKHTPNAIALVHEDTEISFVALNEHANRIAHTLRDMGVSRDSIVGLHCTRDPCLVAGALGILKAGGAYLPLDPEYPQDRLAHFLNDSGAHVVVTQASLEGTLPLSDAEILVIDRDPRIASADTANPVSTAAGHDLAYMIYTSGSTGLPKGVMIEHRNVLNFYAGMDAVVPDRDGAAWLAVTSLSFDISVLELFYTMARGIKVVLPTANQRGILSGGSVRKASDGMEFSLYYWGNDDGVGRDKYRLLLEGAKFADENGFCAVWTPERHFHAFGGPYPNPSVTGAAVAGITQKIGVRAGSCVAPLHHPARIAEEWAVIDNLTNGRAGIAIASGWQPDDFVLRPENTPPDNKPAMFEAIDQVRKLWRGEAVSFPRKDGQLHEVVTQPRPVSKELPIWVTTAGNPETWEEAGRNGANILTHLLGQSIDEVGDKISLYRQALRDAGHDPAGFSVTLMLHTCIAGTRDEAREIAREPMKDYLRSAAGLIKQYAWAFPAFKKPQGVKNAFEINLGDLSEDDLEGILDFAFERYFNDSGLFGTVEDALQRVDQLRAIGVTEIACLIDYGISTDQVLEGLKPLAEVVRLSAPTASYDDADYSIAAMIGRHGVTHLQCTPSMARMIAMDHTARAQLRDVKHLFLGGEALPGALVSDLQQATKATITNMYGPTEATIWSSTERADAQDATVNIGRPIANTQMYVLDEAMQPVAVGEEGALWIGGAGVTRGYWKREDLTTDRYRPNPFSEGRIYCTGDLVQRRPDGRLNFLGRSDHQVKLRGFRIELGEIENVIEDFKGVTNAVVLAREDVPGDVRLVGYMTTKAEVDTKSLRGYLSSRLPDYMIPAHYVTLDAFPVTPNQKIDRKALPAPSKSMAPTTKAAPKTAINQNTINADVMSRIAGIWTEVLGVNQIKPEDNFFDLGGHSLLAVQTHRAIRDRLEIAKLSITDIFQFPTLGALSDRVATIGGGTVVAHAQPPSLTALQMLTASDRAAQRAEAMARRRKMRARRMAS